MGYKIHLKQISKNHAVSREGFTLLELVVTMTILIMIGVFAIVAINPTDQIAKSRNAKRISDINVILGAVGQNSSDNEGKFSCSSGTLPTSTSRMAVSGAGSYNIAPCLVSVYLEKLPYDPATTSAHYTSVTDYDTGYTISQSSTTGRITISAPAAELGTSISATR
ncbi:MAG: hypothetical protein KGJ89_04610 [Patescibacteria group bacterium]|nr:hypothetical protein [Patescibacteria group bacterium]MDE2015834.1 hypothetical protein [Patescibacteria group bacterium]MDE2227209.1 hypothetical protein [Patescibacteria group bacterium]